MKQSLHRNQKGLSLLEGILASGLLAGLALVGTKLTEQTLKGQKTAEYSFARMSFQQQLIRYQNSKSICELNLLNKTFKENPEERASYLSAPDGNYQIQTPDGSPQPFLTDGQEYNTGISASALIYQGYEIQNLTGNFSGTLPADGSSGFIDVIFKFNKKHSSDSYSSSESDIRIKTFVIAENASTGEYRITGCESSNVNSPSLMCQILGGTHIDVAPTGDGPEDMCTQLAGYGRNAETAVNTSLGVNALANLTTGVDNIAIGNNAGTSITTGSSNLFIGNNAGDGVSPGASGKIFIKATEATGPATSSGPHLKIAGYIEGREGILGSDDATFLNLNATRVTTSNSLLVNGYLTSEKTIHAKDRLQADGHTFLVGGLRVTGDTRKDSGPNTWTVTSDARAKMVKHPYTKGLKEILSVKPINYVYKPEFDPEGKDQIGILAQQIAPYFPEAITQGDDGYLRFTMDPVFWALINAVKEQNSLILKLEEKQRLQDKKISELQELIKKLSSRMDKMER